MSDNFVKKYWAWTEKYNTTVFKLGSDITPLVEQGLVVQDRKNQKHFFGKDKNPLIVFTEDGKITCVIYRKIAPYFNEKIRESESLEELEKKINASLVSVDKDASGDIFMVLYKGSELDSSGIMRR
jgi:hypothetical protein